MPLSAIIEGEFFNKYVKIGKNSCFLLPTASCVLMSLTGDVLMISEGRSGIDNVYSLRNGWFCPLNLLASSDSC